MEKYKKLVMFCALCLLPIQAFSAETEGPLSAFRQRTQAGYFLCKATAQLAFMQVSAGTKDSSFTPISECVGNAKTEIKPAFSDARGVLKNKPAALALLKDYYVTWSSALDGIQASPGERAAGYNRRQEDAELRFNETWTKFELEADI